MVLPGGEWSGSSAARSRVETDRFYDESHSQAGAMKIKGNVAWLGMMAMLLLGGSLRAAAPAQGQWRLVWSDEFNGVDGSQPDLAKWDFDTGGNGWGNKELESYTSRLENVQQRGGNLVITAIRERYTGLDGMTRPYTSARLTTKGQFAQAYGRFEARMKLPLGKGIWPAFWMLGANNDDVRWPACGEIDMMENIGEPGRIYSTLHGPGYSGAKGISEPYNLPAGEGVNTDFHVYAVEWEPERIRFYLDDRLIVERTPKDLPPETKWVYDHPFFLILNVAVGGEWPGYPDETTMFPQSMLVDYVRVYRKEK
jgi:beta-glucanase (GH16 family)